MISRRNIRVKVMQELYAQQSGENIDNNNPVANLQKQLEQTRQLFTYLLYFITEVARYAETDAKIRAQKNLPTEHDRNVNTKIAGNQVLWQILEHESFKREASSRTIEFSDTKEQVKKTYHELLISDEYQKYVHQQGRDKKVEKDIMLFIFTDLMLPDEDFINHLEEHFTNWDDDAEMMNQFIQNYLQKPGSYSLQHLVGEEKRNWDSERIASLDMILMQMGVCEFLYFETIPPKVTINEYIDIAKEYSTQQSGQFVNGILDSIHKDLLAQNKIHKIDFKQKA
jgi:N utilization substance protein B